MSKAPKIRDLLERIRVCISSGKYLDTRHATKRQAERNITRPEILHVLMLGFHEPKKDKFDEAHKSWNYAIRGKSIDERTLRIILSFDENNMVIITAIELRK